MGTNYYTTLEPPCPHCGRGDERLHIGKSSSGWAFLFAPYPEHGLNTFADWKRLLSRRVIVDEYGRTMSLADFESMVAAKQGGLTSQSATVEQWGWGSRDYEHADPEGYRFARDAEFS